jgi:outer membrane protein OmpA-like peptidoglycan-associated protein
MKKHFYLLLVGFLIALTQQVKAEESVWEYDTAPDAEALERTLGLNTRSIVFDDQVLVFPIYFSSGSTRITRQATPFLNTIGRLMTKNTCLRFKVEGHTDSIGNAARNRRLSRSRAIAVRKYLIRKHSIKPSRLVAVGKGSREPLKGRRPQDPANRRVQFRRIF